MPASHGHFDGALCMKLPPDVAKVFLNQECRVSPEAYTDRKYRGFVAEMAPEANRQKGTLQVKVQIRDPDKFLTPELTATVEFLPRTP